MKKLWCLLAVLAVCLVVSTAVSAEAVVPTGCAAGCENPVWEPLPETSWQTLPEGHYHYYLTKNDTVYRCTPNPTKAADSKNSAKAITVCLDLNGYHIATNGRSFGIYNDCTLNLMDSSVEQTGYVQGSTGSNNPSGGTMFLYGTMNLYGGTLKFLKDDTGHGTGCGCVVNIASGGTLNMYGGRIEGSEVVKSTYSISYNGHGGAITVSNGALNLYGGEITEGSVQEGCTGPCVYICNSSASVTLSGNSKVDNIYVGSSTSKVNISGAFSGKARVTYADSISLSGGQTVGSASNTPSITGDLFCTNGDGWLVNVSGSDLKLAAFTPSGERHYCQHCKDVVKWEALPEKMPTAAGEYHYYLDSAKKPSQMTTPDGVAAQVCLDLYGKGIDTDGRAFIVKTGTLWNIMDSVGGGYICGTSGNNNTAGGTVTVQVDSVMNLYSGTLKYTYDGTGHKLTGGGVVNMRSTVNVYGGRIEGTDLAYEGAPTSTGAAVLMTATAKLNVYGGSITSGAVPAGSVGPCVYVTTGGAVTLGGSGSVEDIYFPTNNKKLAVTGDYTGTAGVTFGTAVALGEQVGTADAANITGRITCTNGDWLVKSEAEQLLLTIDAPVVGITDSGEQGYETLQAAVDGCEGGYLKLLKPINEDVTVGRDIRIDLNGNSITGTVTVAEGAILYGMDTRTDDYAVADGVYGTLTVTGQAAAEDGYLLLREGEKLSFHKVTVRITDMTLRPAEAGIYYKSSFLGDEKVAAAVESFGVALSVYEIPQADNLDICGYSVFEDFVPGADSNATNSTLLRGILKTGNSQQKNSSNLYADIYGRPYIKTADGYLFGEAVSRDLAQQLQDVDAELDELKGNQLHAVMTMYETYESLLQFMESAKAEKEADTLKILGIGNSYTIDCMWMLNAVYQAEQPGKNLELGIVYYSGCTLSTHVKYINSQAAEYDYYILQPDGTWKIEKDVNIERIVNDKDWDLVSMQQGSGTSGVESTYNSDIQTIQDYVKRTLGYTPVFFWNMTWAYPEMDIPTDNYDLTNAPNASNFKKYYGSSQETMYRMITQTVQNKILPDSSFRWIMPVGTAVQNAQSSYMTDLDLYRDYTHLSDFARLMAAYVWYSRIEGVIPDSIQLTSVPAALKKSYTGSGDMVLTEKQVFVLEESLKNALQTPFTVTQSQYTD